MEAGLLLCGNGVLHARVAVLLDRVVHVLFFATLCYYVTQLRMQSVSYLLVLCSQWVNKSLS